MKKIHSPNSMWHTKKREVEYIAPGCTVRVGEEIIPVGIGSMKQHLHGF